MLIASTEVPINVAANIAFGIVALGMIAAAIRVVTTKNIVHAALYLVLVLAGVGVNFLLLQAEFLAITQFLVYIGAIVVLFLFGIMLTRAPLGVSEDLDNPKMKGIGLLTALMVLAVTSYSVLATFGADRISLPGGASTNTADLSDEIFSKYLIPFEVISVLLLAALIGAIVLARRD